MTALKQFRHPKAVAFCLLVFLSALLQCLPLLYGDSDLGLLLYALHPWAITLPFALVSSFFVSRVLNPLAAFFPPGLCFLLSPLYPGFAGAGLVILLLSLFSAEAGSLYFQQSKKEGHHGAKRFRR
ncbi:MAG: hypothetical protein IJ174_02795 [Clostridia bacterium]|nr:hypothetical protein [Clostridia bacterium]